MQNVPKLYFIVGLILIIIVGLVFVSKQSVVSPTQVISNPAGYEAGTTLSLYESTPPSMPSGIVLESNALTHSSVITLVDGRTKSRVEYSSEKGLQELVDMHKVSLVEGGWKLVVDATNERVATISGEREGAVLIITMVKNDLGTSMTFQYEK